jgi:hypothetical protein
MGLRERFFRLLATGTPPVQDPDSLRELTTVRGFEGPMIVAELRVNGIEAISVESFNVVTKSLTDARIMVHAIDLPAAQAVVGLRP